MVMDTDEVKTTNRVNKMNVWLSVVVILPYVFTSEEYLHGFHYISMGIVSSTRMSVINQLIRTPRVYIQGPVNLQGIVFR